MAAYAAVSINRGPSAKAGMEHADVRCHQIPKSAWNGEDKAPILQSHNVVRLTYQQLLGTEDLRRYIEQAYGPDGLGVLVVADVPDYLHLRQQLLPLAPQFAALPNEVKAQYEDSASQYHFGWSHGQEAMKDGQKDLNKGSYYNNPLEDELPCTSTERKQNPAYFGRNIWPAAHMPEMEVAFKAAGQKICDVGLLLLQHCDRYVSSHLASVRPGQIAGVLQRSRNPKARLLHYFATDRPAELSADDHAAAWCGWHTDNGSLTGLMSAMYIDAQGQEVPNPDPASGLYIRDRHGDIVKAAIPPDCIAFQVGEALQIHSGGRLRATPHYVRAAGGPRAAGISRNTYAVFMQPDPRDAMEAPAGVASEEIAIGLWQPGQTFGQFAEATFHNYYGR